MNTPVSFEFTHPSTWPRLSPSDARFLGRLSAIGVALPNAESLSVVAEPVDDVSSPEFQYEVDRLVTAADAIASIPGVNFLGLAHSQLAVTEKSPRPLQLFLAPAGMRELPTELTIGDMAFQALANTRLILPMADEMNNMTSFKEGCFSSGPVSVVNNRFDSIPEVATVSRSGELVVVNGMQGLPAVVVQHEYDHGQGRRAADNPLAGIRNWVSRDELPAYRDLDTTTYHQWLTRCTLQQWLLLSRQPDYPFLDTEQLQEEFAAGAYEQQVAMLR